jgi:hypothetical protein
MRMTCECYPHSDSGEMNSIVLLLLHRMSGALYLHQATRTTDCLSKSSFY